MRIDLTPEQRALIDRKRSDWRLGLAACTIKATLGVRPQVTVFYFAHAPTIVPVIGGAPALCWTA
jgi:hypothetical protein